MGMPNPGPVGPFRVEPRLDAKPWGGRRLEHWGMALPAETAIGEALLTSPENLILDGSYAGCSIGEVVASAPEVYLGPDGYALCGNRPLFPILVKLIDAATALSIQVHPNDSQAPAGSRGKTEAWYVLEAEPGAVLYVGLADPASFDQLADESRNGVSIGPRMRQVPVRPGDCVFIPAGTVHAIGAGVLVYEIQQPSDITYRFDDWGRLDEQGKPRTLHVEEAIAVSVPESVPEIRQLDGQEAVRCREFEFDILSVKAGESISIESSFAATAWTCLSGSVRLAGESATNLAKGETAVSMGFVPHFTLDAEVASTVAFGRAGRP